MKIQVDINFQVYINSEYLEYLLNLASQGYFSECYEAIMFLLTRLKNKLYLIIALNWDWKNLKGG